MNAITRLTKRKLQVRRLLESLDPPGIAPLNELRTRSFWDVEANSVRLSLDDHKKSFTRTLLEHGEPFEVLNLSRTHEGIPKVMTAGILARWAVWEFIERGLLTSIPSYNDIELCLGYDACSGIIPLANEQFAVLGTTCRYGSLWLVADQRGSDRIAELNDVPWTINGARNGGHLEKIKGSTPLHELAYLPSKALLSGGKELSMAKLAWR